MSVRTGYSGWLRIAGIAGVMAAVMGTHSDRALAQNAPALFSDLAPGASADQGVTSRTPATRVRRVAVRGDVIAAALASGTPSRAPMTLNLFPDVALSLTRERLETGVTGRITWVGGVVGEADSVVSLTWDGRVLTGGGVVRGVIYDINTEANGVVVVSERGPGTTPAAERELAPVGSAPLMIARASTPAVLGDGPGVDIDLLVLYTSAAELKAGGPSQIQSQLANAVAVTNTAFQRSGVGAQVRAVGIEAFPYVEATDLAGDLSAIRLGGAHSAAVEARRDAVGADLVALVTGRPSSAGGCGIALIGPSTSAAYSVSEQACLYAGQWSFSHELGHNLGADHAPGDSSPVGASYARGYRDSSIRTLMAYAVYGSPVRSLNYSSAAILEPTSGLPTGNSLQDNARRLSETASLVAGYRATVVVSGPGLSAPTALSAHVTGQTATFSWSPVEGATSYLVQGGSAPGDAGAFSTAVTDARLTGALPAGTYYWRVRAQSPLGVSAASADAVVTIAPTATTAPGVPLGLTSSVNGSSATFFWSAPTTGGSVTSYELEGGPSPGSAAYGRLAVLQSPYTVANLPAGSYFVRVRAVGPGGTSAPSADTLVTVGAACSLPAASTLAATVGGGMVSLTWTPPASGGPYTYRLAVGRSPGASDYGVFAMGAATSVTAAAPAGTYYVRVLATNSCGTGPASADVTVTR